MRFRSLASPGAAWGPYSAQGIGCETASNCIPNCATGAPVTMVKELTLSQPENAMFTLMTEQDSAGGPPSTWTYPSPVACQRLIDGRDSSEMSSRTREGGEETEGRKAHRSERTERTGAGQSGRSDGSRPRPGVGKGGLGGRRTERRLSDHPSPTAPAPWRTMPPSPNQPAGDRSEFCHTALSEP
jgi:hypothetical protein